MKERENDIFIKVPLSCIGNDESNINQKVKLKKMHWKLKQVIHFGTLFYFKQITHYRMEGVNEVVELGWEVMIGESNKKG